MRSVVVRRFGGPEVLEVADSPVPEPEPGELRIRVAAASVNAIDLSTRAGRLVEAGLMSPADEIGIGWDLAGHVDAVGPDVRGRQYTLGAPVVGLRDLLVAPGTHAEHVVLHESAVAPAPISVPLAAAATLPLNGLAADRSLALAGLTWGQSLLVTGAIGGVGGFVLELAAIRGLCTIAAVRGDEQRDLARRLGANEVVTASDGPLGPAVRRLVPLGVDAVIDAALLGIDAHAALRSGGTFVALVRPFAPPPIRGTTVVVQEVHADGGRLTELSALVDAGLLTLRVADTLPLNRAAEAHARLEQGHLTGRLVLEP